MENEHELPPGWAVATIREMLDVQYGKGLTEANRDSTGHIPVFGSNGLVGYHSSALVREPCLIIGRKGAAGAVHISEDECWPIDTTYYARPPNGVTLRYLYYSLTHLNLGSLDSSTAVPSLSGASGKFVIG